MVARDLIDKTRANFVNSASSPTRAVVYIRASDSLDIPLNAYVSGTEFNQDDRDGKKVNKISCRTLILEQEPTKLDTITYDSIVYNVVMWDKAGNSYTVEAENKKRNKVTTRKFQ